LSDLKRKSVEPIALASGVAVRTLQEFLSHMPWDHAAAQRLLLRQVAAHHGAARSVGVFDESGHAKQGNMTAGVQRQYCGESGKIDNCVVGVHLSYAAPGFQVLLDSALYLPEEFANDPARRKKLTCPRRSRSAPSRRSPWN
jgi:SRSO17 transposase